MRNWINYIRQRLSKQARRVIPWFKVDGDLTLRLNYDDLVKGSLVFDVGGYKGQWASDIFSKYQCAIKIFEPVTEHAKFIEERFKENENIVVYDYGLQDKSEEKILFLGEDGSSLYKRNSSTEKIKIKSASEFIKENGIENIDLMKINIEGGEYPLLEDLIDNGIIQIIDNLQIQFHDFVPEARKRMTKIQCLLTKTHELTFQYEFVWENWKRKV